MNPPQPLSATDAKYQTILHELMDMATDIARTIHKQATDTIPGSDNAPEAPDQTQPDLTIRFDRVARTIRRTIALARSLHEPPRAHQYRAPKNPAPTSPESNRTQARKRIIRRVEDEIHHRHADTDEARALRAELNDRLDDPDLDDDIATRPVDAILNDIFNDLGLNLWTTLRRTPEDVSAVATRAAEPPVTGPRTPHPDRRPPAPGTRPPMDDAALVKHVLQSARR